MALVDKYYGHRNHRLCSAGSKLKKQNADVISGGRRDLVDNYTREEIKVKFRFNCLFAESRNQRSTEAHKIMAMSVLEFISKISCQSNLYTTPVFRDRLGWIKTQTTAFDEFIWAFRHKRYNCLSVSSMRRAILKDATRCYGGTTTKNKRLHQEDDHRLRAWNTSIER